MRRISKKIFLVLCVIALSLLWAQIASAWTLDLLGVRWEKTQVTVLIKPAKAVSESAVSQVEVVIDEVNEVLIDLDIGLTLAESQPLKRRMKSADIVIRMKVGGGSVLGQTLLRTANPFSCELKRVDILLSGKLFGENFSHAGIGNVIRHELLHALGLGHSDNLDDLMFYAADWGYIFGEDDSISESPSQHLSQHLGTVT